MAQTVRISKLRWVARLPVPVGALVQGVGILSLALDAYSLIVLVSVILSWLRLAEDNPIVSVTRTLTRAGAGADSAALAERRRDRHFAHGAAPGDPATQARARGLNAAMLKVGDLAPEFSAQDQHAKPSPLAGLLERGRLVLYFYPKDFTPVCTAQACTFRDASTELAHSARTSSASVVTRSIPSALRRNAQRALLADRRSRASHHQPYRATLPILNHTLRVTYVIDTNRRILGAFHHEFSAAKHLEDVKHALEAAT